MFIWISALFLLSFHCDQYVSTSHVFHKDHQLYVGNRCQLKNGGEGICTRAIECPERIEQIRKGDYSVAGRCGFKNEDEIFCCAKNETTISKNPDIRPAEAACKKYKQILKKLNDGDAAYTLIGNGVSARSEEFSHVAALGYSIPEGEEAGGLEYACGGTLISEKHVLTAAHCANNDHGLIPSEVLLGTNDLNETGLADVQRIRISNIVKHPEYKRGSYYHDLAILELEHSVKFTNHVYPTCLTTKPLTKGNVDAHTSLIVLGWGAVDLDGNTSTKLVRAEGLKFVNKKRCCKRYENLRNNIPNGLDDAMICVRDPDVTRKADTCGGSSGGPLFIPSDKFPTLIGVTSFGQACGANAPVVYSAVYKYLNWIEDQVWPNFH